MTNDIREKAVHAVCPLMKEWSEPKGQRPYRCNKMKVVSLFDGIACGLVALKRAGIKVSEYHAFEIDKYAIQIAKKNHPEIIHHGEISPDTDFSQFKGADLVIGGSPCQGFSFAGKQLAFDDPRSKLFFEFVRALGEISPRYFLLENVKMKKEYLDVISRQMGVQPVLINSALVSAQNRQRYYWCNWKVEQPEDKGIYLKDIIEQGVVDRDKSFCIDANYWKGGNLKSYFEKHRRQLVFELKKYNNRIEDISIDKRGLRPHRADSRKSGLSEFGRIMFVDGKKTDTITASHAPKIVLQTSERGRRLTKDGTKRDDKNGVVVRGYEIRPDGKTCALTTIQKDNYITEDFTIRKLTPIECERLQTLPDNYSEGISNSQRYRALGNAWTVAVIEHIFRELKQIDDLNEANND